MQRKSPIMVNSDNIGRVCTSLTSEGAKLGIVDQNGKPIRRQDDLEATLGSKSASLEQIKLLTQVDVSRIMFAAMGKISQIGQVKELKDLLAEDYFYSEKYKYKKYKDGKTPIPENLRDLVHTDKEIKNLYLGFESDPEKDQKFEVIVKDREKWGLADILRCLQDAEIAKLEEKGVALGGKSARQQAEEYAIVAFKEKIVSKRKNRELITPQERWLFLTLQLRDCVNAISHHLPLIQGDNITSEMKWYEFVTNFAIVIDQLRKIKSITSHINNAQKAYVDEQARKASLAEKAQQASLAEQARDINTKQLAQEWYEQLQAKLKEILSPTTDALVTHALTHGSTLESDLAEFRQAHYLKDLEEKNEIRERLLAKCPSANEELASLLLAEYSKAYSHMMMGDEIFSDGVSQGVSTQLAESKVRVQRAEVAHAEAQKSRSSIVDGSEISRKNSRAKPEARSFVDIIKDNYKQFLFYTLIAAGLAVLGVFTFGVGTAVGISATVALSAAGTGTIFGVQHVVRRKYGKTTEQVQDIESDSFGRDDTVKAESKSLPVTVVVRKGPASAEELATTVHTALFKPSDQREEVTDTAQLASDPRGEVADTAERAEEGQTVKSVVGTNIKTFNS